MPLAQPVRSYGFSYNLPDNILNPKTLKGANAIAPNFAQEYPEFHMDYMQRSEVNLIIVRALEGKNQEVTQLPG
jgi:hypothetical protein